MLDRENGGCFAIETRWNVYKNALNSRCQTYIYHKQYQPLCWKHSSMVCVWCIQWWFQECKECVAFGLYHNNTHFGCAFPLYLLLYSSVLMNVTIFPVLLCFYRSRHFRLTVSKLNCTMCTCVCHCHKNAAETIMFSPVKYLLFVSLL